MKNFIEFTAYESKQRILIDINDIRCITEQNNYTCKLYFFSDTKLSEVINLTYDEVIERLKKAKLN
jgi:hypothetical protein